MRGSIAYSGAFAACYDGNTSSVEGDFSARVLLLCGKTGIRYLEKCQIDAARLDADRVIYDNECICSDVSYAGGPLIGRARAGTKGYACPAPPERSTRWCYGPGLATLPPEAIGRELTAAIPGPAGGAPWAFPDAMIA